MNLENWDLDLSKFTDWRLPENRLECFRRVCVTRLMEGDLDHWHVGLVISDQMKLSLDQQAMYCLLFGQSYRNHWAMIVLQEFPDILNVDIEQIVEWHNKNWKRAFYAKDTKWGLRKFTSYIQSIKEELNGESPYEWIKKLSTVGSTQDNFYSLNEGLQRLHGIGRMTAWLTQQTIYEFFNFDINHYDIQLYSDTWSQYDGLCYLFNREDIATKRNGIKVKPSKEDIQLMEDNFQILVEYVNSNSPCIVDVYNIESCLCEHRKHWQTNRKPKEFPMWTTRELAEEFKDLSESWKEVDWKPYIAGICSKGDFVTDWSLTQRYFTVGVETGMNLNTHLYYSDEPNAHEILSLPIVKTDNMKFIENKWNNSFSEYERNELKTIYDPRKYLRLTGIQDKFFTGNLIESIRK